MPETFSDRETGQVVQPCPLKDPPPKPKHWIEIQLVGEDGSPMPWFEYEVTLPAGTKVRGYLDEHGQARIDNIETPGTAQISFVSLDEEAWAAAGGH